MYDDLIAALRDMSKMGMKYGMAVVKMREAADAIEELSRDLDSMNEANIALYGALPKWIPVTERLPDESIDVLCCTDEGQIVVGWLVENRTITTTGYECEADGGFVRNIAHWMPLPQPPKAEEGE